MEADYLDQRLVGRQLTLTATDLTVGVTFYGILYRLHAATPLQAGEVVRVVKADQHGLTVEPVVIKGED